MMQNSTYNFLKRQCANEKCASLAKLAFLNYEKDPISLQWIQKKLGEFKSDFNITNEQIQANDAAVQSSKNDSEETIYRDYRIEYLYVNNYRKYPYLRLPVGINMTEKDLIRSLFLVGRNGIGKSSLYAALEAICRGYISEAKLRDLPQANYEVHNDIASNMSSERTCVIKTKFGVFDTYEKFYLSCGVDISACFCTENDIYEVGKTNFSDPNGLKTFFIKCLGFNHLLNIREKLKEIKKELNQEYRDVMLPETPTKTLGNINIEIDQLIKQLTSNKVENEANQDNLQIILNKFHDYYSHLDKNSLSLYKVTGEILKLLHNIQIQALEEPIKKMANLSFLLIDFEKQNPEESNTEKLEDIYQDVKNVVSQITDTLNEAIEKGKRAVSINTNDTIEKLEGLFVEKRKYEEVQKKIKRYDETLLTHDVLLTQEVGELLNQINDFFDEEIASFINSDLNERKLIENILTQFSQEDKLERENEKINIVYKEDKTLSISISYYENGELKQGISPSRYYNTFRFKLFCMMLRVAIAFTIMKREKIFFPLIWDDIFYSSDYKNKAQVEYFIKNIVQAFEDIFPERKDMLQIICFTHDELIMKAFIESARTTSIDNNNKRIKRKLSLDDAMFGRLFSYTEMDVEIDRIKIQDIEKFDNLYTIIPVKPKSVVHE